MDIQLDIGRRTDVGRRREHNEDCLGIYPGPGETWRNEEEALRRGTLLVVADGMGGYAAGEIASRTAVEAVINSYYDDLSGDLEESLTQALLNANRAVIQEASRDSERTGMGTTLALAVLRAGELTVSNVGDARVYLIRNSDMVQLSKDHSWVAELIAGGKITPEQARHHPMRNVVTRSLGGRPDVDVEVYPRRHLRGGDILLLCSDGLWGMVPPERIREIAEARPAQAAADALIVAANEAGGTDNITVVVCRVLGAPEESEEEQAADKTELLEPIEAVRPESLRRSDQ